jgi:GeoRSP system SPASM domain protein
MELDFPITIYWDLPRGDADTPYLLRICADIRACRPLMLQVTDPGPAIRKSTIAILEVLKGGPIATILTISPAHLNEGHWGLLHALALKEILLDLESVEELRGVVDLLTPDMGISFRVTAENWEELPALVGLLRERGIRRLVLPMQRLYNGESPFALNGEEQRELAEALAFAGGVACMDLTIHDPFVWRAFYPGVPFPQGGCQAANTMIAIAPDGAVYPCPALPVLLGRIGATSLKEIIASPGKKEFRRGLLEFPAECLGCGMLAECRGGCRGRACAVHGSIDRADPACGKF